MSGGVRELGDCGVLAGVSDQPRSERVLSEKPARERVWKLSGGRV